MQPEYPQMDFGQTLLSLSDMSSMNLILFQFHIYTFTEIITQFAARDTVRCRSELAFHPFHGFFQPIVTLILDRLTLNRQMEI